MNMPQIFIIIDPGLRDGLSWVTDLTTLQGDWTGLLSFVSAVLLSTFIILFLLSSSVSLSNFYLVVPMRGCLGKHSCMSSPFPIAILYGTCSLRALILFCGDVPAIKTKLNNDNIDPHYSIQFVVPFTTLLFYFIKNFQEWREPRLINTEEEDPHYKTKK